MTLKDLIDMSKVDKIKMMGYLSDKDINYMIFITYNRDYGIRTQLENYLELQKKK